MKTKKMPGVKKIALVDDNETIRTSLELLFSQHNHEIACFSSGDAFLSSYVHADYSCIILDVHMEGINGVQLYDQLLTHEYCPQVCFLTGYGDVKMAVDLIKKGAAGFILKPFSPLDFLDFIESCIEKDKENRELWARRCEINRRLALLTTREFEVMQLILKGKLNKQVASELNIAIKTVEVYRARVLDKMKARTALALAYELRHIQTGRINLLP